MTLINVLRPGELDEEQRARFERAKLAVDRKVEPVAVIFPSDTLVQLIYDEDASYVLTFDERTGNVSEAMQDPLSDERRMVVVEYTPGSFGRDERGGGDAEAG